MNKFIILLSAVLAVASALREKREDCGSQIGTFSQCMATAMGGLSNIQVDGRPDLVERKSCNLLESLQACGDNVTGSCRTKEFKDMMNTSMNQLLDSVKQLPGWKTEKCPTAVNFLAGGANTVALGSLSLLALVMAQLVLN